jgi:hypothetical protein
MGSGAMCYMLSKQGYLSDRDGHWRPRLMFFAPLPDPAAWGADLPGSPIIAFNGKDTPERVRFRSAGGQTERPQPRMCTDLRVLPENPDARLMLVKRSEG